MAIDYELIGKRVREVRRCRGLSQLDVANETGLSATYISYIENATKRASTDTLILIADALGVTMDELLAGNQEHSGNEYETDILIMLDGCTHFEKRVICDTVKAVKGSIRENFKYIKGNETGNKR